MAIYPTWTAIGAAVLFHQFGILEKTLPEDNGSRWISWRLKTGEPPNHEEDEFMNSYYLPTVLQGFGNPQKYPPQYTPRIGLSWLLWI